MKRIITKSPLLNHLFSSYFLLSCILFWEAVCALYPSVFNNSKFVFWWFLWSLIHKRIIKTIIMWQACEQQYLGLQIHYLRKTHIHHSL